MIPKIPKAARTGVDAPASRIERLGPTSSRAGARSAETDSPDQPDHGDRVDERLELLELTLHDLQAPVAILDVSMKLLATDLAGAHADVRDTLEDARRAVFRIRQYVDHLVVSERIRRGGFEPRCSPVDLRGMLVDLVNEFTPSARLVGAEISTAFGSTANLSLYGDETLFARVFQNLLENAVRHAGNGGRVFVRAHKDSVVEVRICNNGPSIPRGDRERISRKFASNVRKASSPGLGLYFCRLAVEAHRGTLVVEDDPKWPVCLVVRLPVAAL